ncbi:MAG: DUF922 domain-containing protein [Caldiserica bacterium]|nr:DUF922 domain-containing protein [Caldisericota bacterium]MDH7561837.1 DUF922 domain-containing protein [Caldisericota bacterium]
MKKRIVILLCLSLMFGGISYASTIHPIEHISPIRDASWVKIPFSSGLGSPSWETDRGIVQAETAYIINGRTYVPFRWSVELFGGEATWSSAEDGTTDMVFLYKGTTPTQTPSFTTRLEVCGPLSLDLSSPLWEPKMVTICGLAFPSIPVEFQIHQLEGELDGVPVFVWNILPEPSGFFTSSLFFGNDSNGLTLSLSQGPGAETVWLFQEGTLILSVTQQGNSLGEVLFEVKEDWRPYGPISKGDFKGPPPPEETPEAAEILMRIGYGNWTPRFTRSGTTWTATVGTITTYAEMERNSSWMRLNPGDPGFPALLNHEQKHLDLAQAFAKKFKRVLESLKGEGSTKEEAFRDLDKKVHEAYDNIHKEWEQVDKQYDAETNHGTDAEKQKEWDQKISGWVQNGYP